MEKIINKIITAELYLIFVLPLFFTPFTFFPWHFGKTLIFEILIETLLILLMARKLWQKKDRVEQKKLSLNYLDISVLIFLVILVATSLTGVNFVNSFWGNQSRANGVLVWLHFGVFYFLLKQFFQDRKNWVKVFIFNTIVASLVSLSFVFQKYLPVDWQSTAGGGLIGNRAFFASYLLLSLGLVFYLLTILKSKVKWVLSAPILFFLVLIFYSGIRGAAVGVVAGFFTALLVVLFSNKNKKVKLAVGGFLFLFLLSVGSLLILRNYDFIKNNFPKVYNLTNFSSSEGTGSTRLMAWEIAFKGIIERPILGWGWGNYEVPFNKYYNPQFLKYGFSETVWDKPHNWLLEIGVTAGIFGLISYLIILILAGIGVLKNKIENSWVRATIVGLLVAYLVQDLFLFETTVGLIPWFALLSFVSLFFIGSGCHKEIKWFSFFSNKQVIKKTFLFFCLFFLVFCLYFNFSFFKTSYLMRQSDLSDNFIDWRGLANQVLDDKKSVYAFENSYFLAEKYSRFDKEDAFSNIKKDMEQVGLKIINGLNIVSIKNKNNFNAHFWAGKIYTILGERVNVQYFAEAEKELLLAKNLAPNKQDLLFAVGRLYLLGNNFPKAIEMHQLAVAKALDLGISHWFLGLAYIGAGDIAKGVEEIEKAQSLGYTLDIGQEQYLADIYFSTNQFVKLVDSYKKLSVADPANLNWQIKLAVAYALNGDKKNAFDIAQSLVNQYPELKPQVDGFIKQYNLK